MKLPLSHQSTTIALEAVSGEVALQSALTRLPAFFAEVSRLFTGIISTPIDALFHRNDLQWAATELQKLPYVDLRQEKVPAPPGLTTDYLSYLGSLSKAADQAGRVLEDYVLPLTNIIAVRLANPSVLASHSPDPVLEKLTKSSTKEITRWIKELHGQTQSQPTTITMPYGKLVRRQADWPAIVKHATHIHDQFAKDDASRFKAAVDRLNDLMGTLIQRLAHDKDAYRVAGPALKDLAEASYIVAAYVEFYGLVYRRAVVLDHAIDQLILAVRKFN